MFQRRRPMFQRVTKLLKVSILRRPIIPKLKVSIIRRRSARRVKLLQQYNYRFLQEYQFSPSSSSFILSHGKRIRISKSSLKRIYGLLFLSRCIRRSNDDEHDVDTMTQSWMEMEPLHYVLRVASPAREPLDYFSEDDSIDLKAERFIERFYDEMRLQAREFENVKC